jgi:hypothetical protein
MRVGLNGKSTNNMIEKSLIWACRMIDVFELNSISSFKKTRTPKSIGNIL